MGAMKAMLANKWTTITGLVVGVGQYMGTVGAKAPTTNAEWVSFFWGLGIVVLGIVSKDATTGSRPTPPQAP